MKTNRETLGKYNRSPVNSSSISTKRKYYEKRDAILQKCREDKALCPLCCIQYHRPYLRTHLMGRHRLERSDLERFAV